MVGGNIADGLLEGFIILIVTAAIIGGGAVWMFTSDEIVSEKVLTPQIKLVVKNNKVDTLYVYKK